MAARRQLIPKGDPSDTVWVGRDKVPVRLRDMTNVRIRNLERYLRCKADDLCAKAMRDGVPDDGWYAEVERDLFESDAGSELFLHPIHADVLVELKRRGLKVKEDGE